MGTLFFFIIGSVFIMLSLIWNIRATTLKMIYQQEDFEIHKKGFHKRNVFLYLVTISCLALGFIYKPDIIPKEDVNMATISIIIILAYGLLTLKSYFRKLQYVTLKDSSKVLKHNISAFGSLTFILYAIIPVIVVFIIQSF